MIAVLTSATSAVLLASLTQIGSTSAVSTMVDHRPILTLESANVAALPVGTEWVEAQLRQLQSLGTDWDCNGASPIAPVLINRMAMILKSSLPDRFPAGSVVPASDGSLQAEWHFNNLSFGLVIEEDSALSVWVRPDGQREIDRQGIAALDLFKAATLNALI